MQSKGTIVYLGGFELPDKNAAAHQVINNARILRNLGFKVVFCGIDTQLEWSQVQAHYEVEGFDSYPVPYPKSSKQWIKYLLDFSHLKKIIEMYNDVCMVIAYNVHAIPLSKIIKYCHSHKIAIVANATEWYENKFSLRPLEAIKSIDTSVDMKILQKKVDGIISVSRYLENYYSNHVKNIVVMPPLVDIKEEKWRNSVPHEENQVVEFVYSGGIEPGNKKDKLCPIINCFDNICEDKEFHFSIIGVSEDRFLGEFPEMQEQINHLGKKITFYGRVSHVESINSLKRADYCIFVRDPSRKNNAGFPTKFVESITSGIYIIASNVSDIEQYFPEDGKSILLKDNSQESILEAIKFAISQDTNTLAAERRDGLSDNPFYYMNWQDKMDEFITAVFNNK